MEVKKFNYDKISLQLGSQTSKIPRLHVRFSCTVLWAFDKNIPRSPFFTYGLDLPYVSAYLVGLVLPYVKTVRDVFVRVKIPQCGVLIDDGLGAISQYITLKSACQTRVMRLGLCIGLLVVLLSCLVTGQLRFRSGAQTPSVGTGTGSRQPEMQPIKQEIESQRMANIHKSQPIKYQPIKYPGTVNPQLERIRRGRANGQDSASVMSSNFDVKNPTSQRMANIHKIQPIKYPGTVNPKPERTRNWASSRESRRNPQKIYYQKVKHQNTSGTDRDVGQVLATQSFLDFFAKNEQRKKKQQMDAATAKPRPKKKTNVVRHHANTSRIVGRRHVNTSHIVGKRDRRNSTYTSQVGRKFSQLQVKYYGNFTKGRRSRSKLNSTKNNCYNVRYKEGSRTGNMWRSDLLEAAKNLSKNNSIVLTGGNWAYRGTVLNWIAHAENIGMTQYIVLCYGYDMLQLVGSWQDGGHGILVKDCVKLIEFMFMKLTALLSLNDRGFIVTWSDADALWLRPFMDEWILPFKDKVDMLSQRAQHPISIAMIGGSSICTGLFTMFPSKQSSRARKIMSKSMRQFGTSDDQLFVNKCMFTQKAFSFDKPVLSDDVGLRQAVAVPTYTNTMPCPHLAFYPTGLFPRSRTDDEWARVLHHHDPMLWHSMSDKIGQSKVDSMKNQSVFVLKNGWENITLAAQFPQVINRTAFV